MSTKPDLKFIILASFCVGLACSVAYLAYDIYHDAHKVVSESERAEHEMGSVAKDARDVFKEAIEDRIEHHHKK